MVMKRRGGTKSKIVRRMLKVFNLHFPTPAVEAMSRICACKTERNLQIFGWCLQFKQSCPWATLSYFCLQKQGREINAMRQVVSENVLKRAQRYHLHGMRRSLFANWIHYIATKKPQPLCENWIEKGIGEKRNCGHRLIMHSITHRDEMWGGRGEVRRQWGGGGGGAGGSFTPTYIWAGWNGMTIHITFQSY